MRIKIYSHGFCYTLCYTHRISNEIHLPPVPPKRISCVSDPHDPYTNHNRSGGLRGDSPSTSASAPFVTHLAAGGEPTLKTFSPNNWIPQQVNDSASAGRPLPPTPKTHHHQHQHQTTLAYANDMGDFKPRLSQTSLGVRNLSQTTAGDSSDSGVCGGATVSGGVGGDAMTAIIADSTTTGSTSGSSSGEEANRSCASPRPAMSGSARTTRQLVSASIDIEPYQVLPYDAKKMNPNPPSSATTNGGADVAEMGGCDSDSVIVGRVTMKEMSPMVFTDTITTGGYR